MQGLKHRPARRLAAGVLPVALFITVTGCADDVDEPVGAPLVDEVDGDLGADPSLVGLEVTSSGDVTEVVAPIAFRIDKDGIGAEADDLAEFDDEDFGDIELVDEGVLVIDVRETDVSGVLTPPAVAIATAGGVRTGPPAAEASARLGRCSG